MKHLLNMGLPPECLGLSSYIIYKMCPLREHLQMHSLYVSVAVEFNEFISVYVYVSD